MTEWWKINYFKQVGHGVFIISSCLVVLLVDLDYCDYITIKLITEWDWHKINLSKL